MSPGRYGDCVSSSSRTEGVEGFLSFFVVVVSAVLEGWWRRVVSGLWAQLAFSSARVGEGLVVAVVEDVDSILLGEVVVG